MWIRGHKNDHPVCAARADGRRAVSNGVSSGDASPGRKRAGRGRLRVNSRCRGRSGGEGYSARRICEFSRHKKKGERTSGRQRRTEWEWKKKGTFVMGLDWNVCIQNVSLLRVSFPDLCLPLAAAAPPSNVAFFAIVIPSRTRWPRVSSGGLTPRGAYATNVF